jgi:hypothetical protein
LKMYCTNLVSKYSSLEFHYGQMCTNLSLESTTATVELGPMRQEEVGCM